ncbi:uncharacterized protein LOC106668069 [Cimex lectularius]|uniref:Uncharacterized protein n=1 Tax=Cimex lectularius TaxID=79782 RepID=A0A8I6RT20_CIMLE|nr:uncharacterized protein LOC106668069 [Cimex lectularius]
MRCFSLSYIVVPDGKIWLVILLFLESICGLGHGRDLKWVENKNYLPRSLDSDSYYEQENNKELERIFIPRIHSRRIVAQHSGARPDQASNSRILKRSNGFDIAKLLYMVQKQRLMDLSNEKPRQEVNLCNDENSKFKQSGCNVPQVVTPRKVRPHSSTTPCVEQIQTEEEYKSFKPPKLLLADLEPTGNIPTDHRNQTLSKGDLEGNQPTENAEASECSKPETTSIKPSKYKLLADYTNKKNSYNSHEEQRVRQKANMRVKSRERKIMRNEWSKEKYIRNPYIKQEKLTPMLYVDRYTEKKRPFPYRKIKQGTIPRSRINNDFEYYDAVVPFPHLEKYDYDF